LHSPTRIVNLWKSLDKSEVVTALLLITLGVFIVSQAWGWPYLSKDGPGPGFFPLWTGVFIIALAAVQVALMALQVVKPDAPKAVHWKNSAGVFVGWAGLMVSIALLEWAGFIASFVLLCLFLVVGVFHRSFVAALAVGIISSIAFWLLFVVLLQVRLPVGPWGF
jgi:putative tricarboxylic transport membrane protein